MDWKGALVALGGPEARAVAGYKQDRRTAQALGQYLGQGDEGALQAVYENNPDAGFRAQGMAQNRQKELSAQARDALTQRAKYMLALPEPQRAQAWPSVKASMQAVDADIFASLPDTYDAASFDPVLQQIAQSTNGATGVQSTYVNDQGQRVAILRDGSTRVLGDNDQGMANQTISIPGPDGRERQYTFNKRTGSYEPAGGGMPAPQEAPQAPLANSGGDPQMDALSQAANAMIKAGIPPEQVDAFLMQTAQASPNVQVTPPSAVPAVNTPAPMPPSANMVGGGPVAPLPGSGRSPFVSRSPEETAAATEAAKIAAQQAAAPQQAQLDADAARQKKEAELAAERNATAERRGVQAADTVAVLNDAIAILPQATGGMLGQARDSVNRAANQSTEGSRATAKLKLLAAKLIANVPRFEGPQSNIDVQFYREAAGDLANPELSVGERQAAAELMLEIAQRYAKPQGGQPAPQARVRYDAQGNRL